MNQTANLTWVKRLSGEDSDQSQALTDLRQILAERLHRAFRFNDTVNEAFIEDVVQDALLAILKSLSHFQNRSRFTTWCTTIAIRMAITELRRKRWRDVSLDELLETRAIEGPIQKNLDTEVISSQKSRMVAKMTQIITEQLTPKQKTVLQAELKGMPQSEIARRLGRSRNAIYKVGHDARKKLRSAMKQAGYSADDLSIFMGANS